MRAIQITSHEGPEGLKLVDLPEPQRAANEVLIEVRSAGVAFPELLQTRGLYQFSPPLPFVPGTEVAGVVIAAPEDSEFKPGDRVAALPMLQGFAEQVTATPNLVFPLPDEVDFAAAASFMFNYGTAYFALIERGKLKPGERVLVQGASGGVGSAAVQIAKVWGAAEVIAVTSTEEKGEAAVRAGADSYVLADGFKDRVLEKGKVDIVVDPVGGDRFTDSLRCLDVEGRILVIGFTAGEIPTVKVNRLLLNNLSVIGVSWGDYEELIPNHIKSQWNAMRPHLISGALKPLLGPSFPLEQAKDAVLALESREHTGKITLTV